MPRDYFAILGLEPGPYDGRRVRQRFEARRRRLLDDLGDPDRQHEAKEALEDLHMAYRVLRDPESYAAHVGTRRVVPEPVAELREMIAASLEDGLMRHSRRRAVVERARELGIDEFQTQLLIARVQFGQAEPDGWPPITKGARRAAHPRAWARFAAAGVLALAMFLGLVQWAGV